MSIIHFFCWCVCVVKVCCVLVISLFLRVWIICNGNPLFLAIVSMVFHSHCLSCSVISSVNILFILKMRAARFCSNGWLEVKSIVMSVFHKSLGLNCYYVYEWKDLSSYVIVSLFCNFEFQMFIYTVHVIHYWIFNGFILIKYD